MLTHRYPKEYGITLLNILHIYFMYNSTWLMADISTIRDKLVKNFIKCVNRQGFGSIYYCDYCFTPSFCDWLLMFLSNISIQKGFTRWEILSKLNLTKISCIAVSHIEIWKKPDGQTVVLFVEFQNDWMTEKMAMQWTKTTSVICFFATVIQLFCGNKKSFMSFAIGIEILKTYISFCKLSY